ncbi:hypothetical protein HY635_01345 [Candidatus Uhrbacteria bacterium]|nr:hypothetical protein [Candidatus Uhrbacteria bacterium]
MRSVKNAALVAATVMAALAACTIDARDPQRFEGTRVPGEGGGASPALDAAVPAECVLHSDCPSGQACMNGQCAEVEPEAPDGSMDIGPDAGAAAPDAAESESEAEAEAEAEPDAGTPSADGGAPDGAEEADAGVPAPSPDGGPMVIGPDAGLSEESDAGAPSSADGSTVPDAGSPDAAPLLQTVTTVIEVPVGETVDASAVFCSTFGGGWACAPFALGGESGREIRATFENVVPGQHLFNACLRNCDDSLNGIWMAYQDNGLQERDDPDLLVDDAINDSESLVPNGGLGANWWVNTLPDASDVG